MDWLGVIRRPARQAVLIASAIAGVLGAGLERLVLAWTQLRPRYGIRLAVAATREVADFRER